MRSCSMFTLLALVLAPALAACDDDETGPGRDRFRATLAGPAGVTATGAADFTLEDDGTVSFSLDVNGLTGVTASHIHNGAAGVNGPVLVTLFPLSGQQTPTGAVSGRLETGRFGAAQISSTAGVTMAQLLERMRTGEVYVNVHTTAAPAGAIRGQIQLR